jgi:hypothetical protein
LNIAGISLHIYIVFWKKYSVFGGGKKK